MPRPRHEIMRDLKAILAELDYAMTGGEGRASQPDPAKQRDADISPKLEQALEATKTQPPKELAQAKQPIESHESIRAKARAYKPEIQPDEVNRPEKKERMKDYKQVDDPDWPHDSYWTGTGDHKLIE